MVYIYFDARPTESSSISSRFPSRIRDKKTFVEVKINTEKFNTCLPQTWLYCEKENPRGKYAYTYSTKVVCLRK